MAFGGTGGLLNLDKIRAAQRLLHKIARYQKRKRPLGKRSRQSAATSVGGVLDDDSTSRCDDSYFSSSSSSNSR